MVQGGLQPPKHTACWLSVTSHKLNLKRAVLCLPLSMQKNVANSPFPDPSYLESPASNPDPAHKATIMALRLLDWVKVPGHW